MELVLRLFSSWRKKKLKALIGEEESDFGPDDFYHLESSILFLQKVWILFLPFV